jgi:cytochrome b
MTTERKSFVWDLPTRIFHWALVVSFIFVQGSAEWFQTAHSFFGYTILGLISFRILWGLIGPKEARLKTLIPTQASLELHFSQLKQLRFHPHSGHNPLGGMMALALLSTLTLSAVTGHVVQTEWFWGREWVEEIHEVLAQLSLILVGVHLLAILIMSGLSGQNLAKRMVKTT